MVDFLKCRDFLMSSKHSSLQTVTIVLTSTYEIFYYAPSRIQITVDPIAYYDTAATNAKLKASLLKPCLQATRSFRW